jgi:hypothetical protein
MAAEITMPRRKAITMTVARTSNIVGLISIVDPVVVVYVSRA